MGEMDLLGYFGISGVRAVKERGAFFVRTAAGSFKIHKSQNSPREIFSRYEFMSRLAEAGFSATDAIIPAKDGLPFVALGRDTYVMTRHYGGREADFSDENDVKAIVEAVARFHRAARGFEVKNIPRATPLDEVFAKQGTSLAAVVKQLNRRSGLSDFDFLVLKHADTFSEMAAEASEILAATSYSRQFSEAAAGFFVCHNALKEETFILSEKACYITRFEDICINLQLSDVAAVLRRYARKSSREVAIPRFLEIYNKIAPLPDDAEKILHAELLFPWPFLKLITQFYSKKRNFTPAAVTSRMSGILEEQAGYGAYVGVL